MYVLPFYFYIFRFTHKIFFLKNVKLTDLWHFDFIALKTINYLAFQSFDFERTRWRLFQKRVERTKFDIYVFIMQQWLAN